MTYPNNRVYFNASTHSDVPTCPLAGKTDGQNTEMSNNTSRVPKVNATDPEKEEQNAEPEHLPLRL